MLQILDPTQVEFERRNEEINYKVRLSGYAAEETRLVKSINEKREIERLVGRYLQDHEEWVERIELLEDREDALLRRERAVLLREEAAKAENARLKQSAQALSTKWVEYHTAVSRLNGSIPSGS